MTRYGIAGVEYASNSVTLQAALENAYKHHVRPMCLCHEPPLPMYIAHLDKTYVVKRMPDTGDTHATGCESYEAPPGLSGRGEVDGQAIEHSDEGTVNLKFAFSLRHNNPAEMENEAIAKTTAKSTGTRLTLRGLLHYLWDEAKLSHWAPEMMGKRTWFSVRKALMDAVVAKETKSAALADILYVPEVYDEDRRIEIVNRRLRSLAPIMGPGKSGKKLMMLVGEVDSIAEATFGYALRVKNLPDFPLVMDADLYKNYVRVFKGTINLSDYGGRTHSIVMATIILDANGIPSVQEMCVMVASPEWIPIENLYEGQLVEMLVKEKRGFQKQLRYNLPAEKPIASVVLTDSDNAPLAMYIDVDGLVKKWATTVALNELIASSTVAHWMWDPESGTMDALPSKRGEQPVSTVSTMQVAQSAPHESTEADEPLAASPAVIADNMVTMTPADAPSPELAKVLAEFPIGRDLRPRDVVAPSTAFVFRPIARPGKVTTINENRQSR